MKKSLVDWRNYYVKKKELIENNHQPMSLDQYNAEIDQTMKDSENGRMIKATDLKIKIQKWD
jgi:hypothetical protein